jgi:hypothetical protein
LSAAPAWIGIISSRVTTSPQCIHSAAASIAHSWLFDRFWNGSSGHGMNPSA